MPFVLDSTTKQSDTSPNNTGGFVLDSTSPQQKESQVVKQVAVQNAIKTKAESDYASSFGGIVQNTFTGLPAASGISQTLKELNIDPLNLRANPKNAIEDAWKNIEPAINETGQGFVDLFTAPTLSAKIGAGLKTLAGGAGLVFSPITALFSVAQDYPVLGSIAKIITLPFSVAGSGGTHISNRLVDSLPISQQAKNNIKPGLGEIFSLAAQLIAGKAGDLAAKQIDLAKTYGKNDAETIIKQAKNLSVQYNSTAPNEISINTPNSRHAAYAASQGYEPYTPPENLPVIKMGPRGSSSDLPVMDIKTGKITQPAIKTQTTETVPKEFSLDTTSTDTFQPKSVAIRQSRLSPPSSSLEGVTKQSSLGLNTIERAVSDGLTVDSKNATGYTIMNMEDQAKKAISLVDSNPDLALKIAKGEAQPTGDLRAASVYRALEEKAKVTGDVNLINELVSAKLPEVLSRYGQEIKAADTRITDSPVQAIKDIETVREEAYNKKGGNIFRAGDATKEKAKIVEQGLAEIKKTAPTKQSWNDFIDSIQC